MAIYEKDIYYGSNFHSPFSPRSLTWSSLCLFLVRIYYQLKCFSCSQMFLRRLFSRGCLCPLPTAIWFYEACLQTVIPFIWNKLIICHRNQSQKKNFFLLLILLFSTVFECSLLIVIPGMVSKQFLLL